MRTRSFLTLLHVGGAYAMLVYTWYRKYFPHDFSTDSLSCIERGEKESDEKNIKTRQRETETRQRNC